MCLCVSCNVSDQEEEHVPGNTCARSCVCVCVSCNVSAAWPLPGSPEFTPTQLDYDQLNKAERQAKARHAR